MAKFKKGHKRLGGRKKGTPNKATLKKRLLDELIELLNEKVTVTEIKDGKEKNVRQTRARVFLRQVINHASSGDSHFGKLIFNYLEGMPKQDVMVDVVADDSFEARVKRLRQMRGLPPLKYSVGHGPSLNIAPKVIQAEKRKERENREAAAAARSKLKKPKKSFLKGLKAKKKKARKARKGGRRKAKRRKRTT